MKKVLLFSFFLSFCLFAPPDGNNVGDATFLLTNLQQGQLPVTDNDPDGPYQCRTIMDDISVEALVGFFRRLNVIIVDGLGPMGILDNGLENIEG